MFDCIPTEFGPVGMQGWRDVAFRRTGVTGFKQTGGLARHGTQHLTKDQQRTDAFELIILLPDYGPMSDKIWCLVCPLACGRVDVVFPVLSSKMALYPAGGTWKIDHG